MATNWSDKIVIADLAEEPALSEELGTLIEKINGMDREKVPHVVVNFAQVGYIHSSNIAQLLRLRKRLLECGRTIKLCSVSDEVWSVLLITGLDKVFRFAPDTMTALAGIQLEEEKVRAPR